MTTLFIIATIVILSYPIFFKRKYNITSISESYYVLEGIKEGLGMLFTLWCVTPAFLLFPVWVEIMPEQWQFISFLCVVMLGAVGCAPKFLTHQRVQHYVFAASSVVLATISAVILNTWVIPCLLTLTAVSYRINKNDLVFWVEVAAILGLLITISLRL